MEIESAHPYEPDDATLTLILQLHSEDIKEIQNASKGKGRDDEISDASLAIATYQQEVQRMDTILADRCMSRSVTRAVITDAELLNESLAEEEVAASDRALAHSLAGINNPSLAPKKQAAGNDLDDGFLARLTALYVSEWEDDYGSSDDTVYSDGSVAAESSAWAASRRLKNPTTASRHCTACNSTKPLSEVCQTPCGHFYCQECITTLFELSTADETLFPPRCCRTVIPLQSVRVYLNSVLVHAFEKKSVEFQTSDRTYTSRQECSAFIPPAEITDEQATCGACGTKTCTICKTNTHNGDCPQDVMTQQVLESAREHGWQRCYNCRRIVELDIGCNHMVCPCSAHFCYACGERWKTCQCDQWSEDRLLARANQVVARRPTQFGAAREQQVNQAAAHLRERHNCTHENWRHIAGPHQCEECHYDLPLYIFECPQCRIRVYSRYRMNRL